MGRLGVVPERTAISPKNGSGMARKPCAYCLKFKKPAEMSDEHILSDCLLKAVPDPSVTFSGKAKRVFKAAPVIGDVCCACNNGPLAVLDAYAKQLWTEYFSKFVLEEEVVQFEFDYHLLLRWILKTSFNSARADGKGLRCFTSDMIRYIRDGGNHPADLFLYVSIIKPTEHAGARLLPEARRCTRINNDVDFKPWETWIVAIRSYQLLAGIQVDNCNEEEARQYFLSIKKTMPGVLLESSDSSVPLMTSHYDTIQAYGAHFDEHGDKYLPFSAESRRLQAKRKAETTHVPFWISPPRER